MRFTARLYVNQLVVTNAEVRVAHLPLPSISLIADSRSASRASAAIFPPPPPGFVEGPPNRPMKNSTGEEDGEVVPTGDSRSTRPFGRERALWTFRVTPPTSPKRLVDTALPREWHAESLAGIARGGTNAYGYARTRKGTGRKEETFGEKDHMVDANVMHSSTCDPMTR